MDQELGIRTSVCNKIAAYILTRNCVTCDVDALIFFFFFFLFYFQLESKFFTAHLIEMNQHQKLRLRQFTQFGRLPSI